MARIRITARIETAKQLLSEIHVFNMIAKYKDINKANTRRASVPEVGIFWVDLDTNKVFADKTSLRDADDMGPFKIHPRGHYEVWKKMIPKNPKWRGQEYEDIPRGRVVYDKNPKNPRFVVFMAKECNKGSVKSAVASEFNLPAGHYVFDFTDEHYELL